MRGKRGQITIFIIIAIVLLLGAAIYFYAFDTSDQETESAAQQTAQLADEVQPVQQFVDACVARVGREAIEELSLRGGFLSLKDPRYGQSMEQSHISTESEVVLFGPDYSFKVPYWYHMSSENDCQNCQFGGNNPSDTLVQDTIGQYILDEIPLCFNNFESFTTQGWQIIPNADLATIDVSLREEDVRIIMDYPIIAIREGQHTIGESYVELDVDLKKMLDLSREVTLKQLNYSFLEYNTMNLISAYGDLEQSALPPIADFELGASGPIWSKTLTQMRVMELLQAYVGTYTVEGTRNFFPPIVQDSQSRIEQGTKYSLVLPIVDQDETRFQDIDIKFSTAYNALPYFDISPSEGDIVRPKQEQSSFKFLLEVFSQQYEFYYDISYPVIVEVRDPEAFGGDGASFLFALETNVRYNEPKRPPSDNDPIIIDAAGAGNIELFSSPEQWISDTFEVNATSAGQALDDAQVRYYCGPFTANIGATNEDGYFEGKLPICTGGVIEVGKEGYHPYREQLDASYDNGKLVRANLHFIQEVPVTMTYKDQAQLNQLRFASYGSIDFNDLRAIQASSITQAGANSTTFVTIEKLPDSDIEKEFAQTITLLDGQTQSTVKLIPGRYHVEATYIDEDGYVIEQSTMEVPSSRPEDQFSGKKDKITLPRIPEEEGLTMPKLGGAVIDGDLFWEIDEQDLYAQNKYLEMFVIKGIVPQTHEQLKDINSYLELSRTSPSSVMPKWREANE